MESVRRGPTQRSASVTPGSGVSVALESSAEVSRDKESAELDRAQEGDATDTLVLDGVQEEDVTDAGVLDRAQEEDATDAGVTKRREWIPPLRLPTMTAGLALEADATTAEVDEAGGIEGARGGSEAGRVSSTSR